MKDRIPASGKGGRVSLAVESFTVVDGILHLTADDGAIYGTLGHADDATQAGSAYNKANILPASVTSALGLTDASAEPKDAFLALNSKITTANTNIKTLTNITSGSFTRVTTSDKKATENDPPDWQSVSTGKTDFLISVSASVASTSRTLNIAVGTIVFSREIKTGTTVFKPRIWKSGNAWLCLWDDGVFGWDISSGGSSSYVVKAYLNSQSVANGNVVNSLTVYGR